MQNAEGLGNKEINVRGTICSSALSLYMHRMHAISPGIPTPTLSLNQMAEKLPKFPRGLQAEAMRAWASIN